MVSSSLVGAETLYHIRRHVGIDKIDSNDERYHMKGVEDSVTANGIEFRITYQLGSGFTTLERKERLKDALSYVASVLNETGELDVLVQPPSDRILGTGILAVGGTFFGDVFESVC